MTTWNLPPKAKIYEGLSAIADGRIRIGEKTQAEVDSSSRDKTYIVEWSDDFSKITSNDNASYWQGYLGYPIIAVLLKLERIQYNKEILPYLTNIQWKQINRKYKNDWDKAVDEVLLSLTESGVSVEIINNEVDKIMEQLQKLSFEKLSSRRQPPKSN